MICKYCHHEISDTANFCEECGLSTKGDDTIKSSNTAPKRRTNLVSLLLALIIIITAIFVVFKFGGGNEKALKGVWSVSDVTQSANDTFTYTFKNGTGTTTYNGTNQNYNAKEVEFKWYITNDKDLIILWSNTSCTNYKWNPNFSNYKLSANEYNWYVKGDKLYLSTSSAELGFNEYIKQANK